jgi:hypothetical protein
VTRQGRAQHRRAAGVATPVTSDRPGETLAAFGARLALRCATPRLRCDTSNPFKPVCIATAPNGLTQIGRERQNRKGKAKTALPLSLTALSAEPNRATAPRTQRALLRAWLSARSSTTWPPPRFRERRQTHARAKPVWPPPGPTHSRTDRNVPRPTTNARPGPDLLHHWQRWAGLRRLGAAWRQPVQCFDGRAAHARMGEALFGGETYNAVPLHTFRQRSRTLAWAKPCLAGRPTALVRTQPPEQHTSRGRPSGMELPDYPVMSLTPAHRARTGPHLVAPPGLFPYS